jgi:hypothetical protein
MTLEDKVLELLIVHGGGLKAPEILAKLRPRVSQPTLWRRLDTLRTIGAIVREGNARTTRYHARERIDPAVLRSRRMHQSVARRLLREPNLRLRALERLAKLRAVNPQGRRYHDRWEELLRGPLVDVVRVMTELSEQSDVLRKESPLSVFISSAERERIFDSVRAD